MIYGGTVKHDGFSRHQFIRTTPISLQFVRTISRLQVKKPRSFSGTVVAMTLTSAR